MVYGSLFPHVGSFLLLVGILVYIIKVRKISFRKVIEDDEHLHPIDLQEVNARVIGTAFDYLVLTQYIIINLRVTL